MEIFSMFDVVTHEGQDTCLTWSSQPSLFHSVVIVYRTSGRS